MTQQTTTEHPAPVDDATCAWCTNPATTTRPTGVSFYFAPRPDAPRMALCERHAEQSDRDVRDVHLDWANDW